MFYQQKEVKISFLVKQLVKFLSGQQAISILVSPVKDCLNLVNKFMVIIVFIVIIAQWESGRPILTIVLTPSYFEDKTDLR